MVNVTLDDRDRAVLQRLRHSDADVESLAEGVGCSPSYLRDRLPDLADNGLVERVDSGASGGGGAEAVYCLTGDGERTILASGSGTGTLDEQIDTPPDIDERIKGFDLRPDREAAVRNALSHLQFWGNAFPGEIVDAGYTEHPAGFESPRSWWDDCVRGRLADLPTVELPDSPDGQWRYTGEPTVGGDSEDGRAVIDDDFVSRNSPRLTLERLDLTDDERTGARSAFSRLVLDGELEMDDLDDHLSMPPEDEPRDDHYDRLREMLERLPGVERDDGRWRYRPPDEGPMSTEPGAVAPDEPPGQPNEERQ